MFPSLLIHTALSVLGACQRNRGNTFAQGAPCFSRGRPLSCPTYAISPGTNDRSLTCAHCAVPPGIPHPITSSAPCIAGPTGISATTCVESPLQAPPPPPPGYYHPRRLHRTQLPL